MDDDNTGNTKTSLKTKSDNKASKRQKTKVDRFLTRPPLPSASY